MNKCQYILVFALTSFSLQLGQRFSPFSQISSLKYISNYWIFFLSFTNLFSNNDETSFPLLLIFFFVPLTNDFNDKLLFKF